ncbi:MAG TPA: glycosyltransferase [Candidatus Babeliales bacterium]|jgi:glycosyltransferase involved in cell wall biosynthesis|nr:glycosyltransferase [Candidatus Babeliales bacterium]
MKHPFLSISLVLVSLFLIIFTVEYIQIQFARKENVQFSPTIPKKGINMMKLSIIIPAYNEEKRIEKTIRAYHKFLSEKNMPFELVIALNGCKDNTIGVVERIRNDLTPNTIFIIDMQQAGKGLALKAGFADALVRNNDLIGFVDADMATSPEAFYDLVINLGNNDGIIASRYMPGAQISPPRPAYKRYGSRIIYEPLVWLLFGLSYYDLQCGAKLFKRAVLEKINSQLTVTQWAFDAELLYLCKKAGYTVKEIPTVWRDQEGSKLTLHGGLRMLSAMFSVWWHHRISGILRK